MVNVYHIHCAHKGCFKISRFGVKGSKVCVYCRQHTEDGMVGISGTRCAGEGGSKQRNFGVKGRKVTV